MQKQKIQNGQGKEHSGRNQNQGRYKKVLSENEDKQAVADCIRAGRPLSDLKNRGIKIAKLTDVLS